MKPITQGIAELMFNVNSEIIALYDQPAIVRAALGANSPAIAQLASPTAAPVGSPADLDYGCSQVAFLRRALAEGGHYFCVSALSDLFAVGIIDLDDVEDLAFREKGHNEDIIWIGYRPVKIDKKIKQPLVLPPMARYVWNHRNPIDLYDLSGQSDTTIANMPSGLNGYFAHYVTLQFGKEPPTALADNNSQVIRWRLIKAIEQLQADNAATRAVMSPTYVFGSDLASKNWKVTTAATNCDVATSYIFRNYHALLTNGSAAMSLLAAVDAVKAIDTLMSCGNKIRLHVSISATAGGVNGVIPAAAYWEAQNGGYYE